jgi:hypothetical protein
LLFDDAWRLAQLLSTVVRGSTGGNELMCDFVAWHVDPNAHQAGFTPQ